MKLKKFNSMNDLSDYASDLIIDEINQMPNLLLCTATGNSPTETYKKLVEKKQGFKTDKLRILKLDEWGGISPENPESCESYLQKNVIGPLQIHAENYIGFQSNTSIPENEILKVRNYLDQMGPIDICILGLGMNGHVALNEPNEILQPYCHLAQLSETTKTHPMVKNMSENPTYGLTIGMADILQSQKIILIVCGKNKQQIVNKLMEKKITTSLPASFLWLHNRVECLILDE